MNVEVPMKYPLSHNDRIVVLEIRLHSEGPMLYRPALHGNWNALSLARRALKDKFPTPTIPLTTVLPNRQVFPPDPVHRLTKFKGAVSWIPALTRSKICRNYNHVVISLDTIIYDVISLRKWKNWKGSNGMQAIQWNEGIFTTFCMRNLTFLYGERNI